MAYAGRPAWRELQPDTRCQEPGPKKLCGLLREEQTYPLVVQHVCKAGGRSDVENEEQLVIQCYRQGTQVSHLVPCR